MHILHKAFEIPRFLPITAALIFVCGFFACFESSTSDFSSSLLSAYVFYLFRVVESMVGSKNYARTLFIALLASRGIDLCLGTFFGHQNEIFRQTAQYSDADRMTAIISLIHFAYRHIPLTVFPSFYAAIFCVVWGLRGLCAAARVKILLASAINLGVGIFLFPHEGEI